MLFFCYLITSSQQQKRMISNKYKISLMLAQITIGGLLTIGFCYLNQFIRRKTPSMFMRGLSINRIFIPTFKQYLPYQGIFPYTQTLTMFIGELLCLPLYFFLRHKYSAEFQKRQDDAIESGKKKGMNRLYLMVPALCDLVTATLRFIALNYISASAYQMVNGGNIITCFLLSILILRQPIKKSQLLGSCLALIGIVIVGIANILHSSSNSDSLKSQTFLEIMGYFLLVLSLFTSGLMYVSQQKLMGIYHLEALEIVGFEGLFGLCTYIIISIVLSFIPCNFGLNACVYTFQGYSFMEGWGSFINEVFGNKILLLLTFCWIFGVGSFNPLGVSITKHINALARAISDVCQTVLSWSIGIIVTLTLGKTYPNLIWQKLDTLVVVLQLIGFLFLVLGNLVYNQIIKFVFLSKDQKDYLAEKSESQNLLAKN